LVDKHSIHTKLVAQTLLENEMRKDKELMIYVFNIPTNIKLLFSLMKTKSFEE